MEMGKKEISPNSLFFKLDALDNDIIKLWLNEESDLSDSERWEIFVVLLETRVALLKTCRDAKLELEPDMAWPTWLDKLSNSRKELRLRELKKLFEDLKKQKYISKYEARKEG